MMEPERGEEASHVVIMPRDSRYDPLFEPIRLGPKVAPNRFYQTPHCTGLGSEFPGAQAHLRAMKAEGGWGVVNTEYCNIHPESDDSPWVGARLWDETDVRNLSLMTELAHEHGALAGVELHYSGANAAGYLTRLPGRDVSQIPSESFWSSHCYEMSKEELRELQQLYVAAALRARRAGFDIINVAGEEVGPVPAHFLMTYYNKRTDEYGGSSIESRSRFWMETLELVSEAVGDVCAVTARLTIDTLDNRETGIRVDEEGVGFVRLADHLVDFWDLQVGGAFVGEWMEDAGPSRYRAENWQLPWLAKVRPYTQKPIVGVGRYTSPDTMIDVLGSGVLDLIGAARASISDPFLPRKIDEGRLDDIRECIGCNMCAARFNQSVRIVCTQNATLGEEYRRGWHPEKFDVAANANDDVLVIGAGPAGMECARVLGERGMERVHLLDAAPEMGGWLQWVVKLPGLGEWRRVVDYRQIQIDKLSNVQFIPKRRLTMADVLEYGADLVVVATGAHWALDGLNAASHSTIEGADALQSYCLTPEQIMVDNEEVPGDDVLIYDCDGYFVGVGLAERLAGAGKKVTIVTPLQQLAPYLGYTGEAKFVLRRLEELGVEIVNQHAVTSVSPGDVRGNRTYGTLRPARWKAASFVMVTQRVSDDALYRELKASPELTEQAGIKGVYRIGDCVQPRSIADAVFDGHRLAREIDTDNPATHLPFIRENRVLGMADDDYDALVHDRAGVYRPSSQRPAPLGVAGP